MRKARAERTPFVPPAQRILRNSTLNLAAYALNAGFNLLALCVLARRLPVDVFGSYFTLFSVMMILQFVLEAGIPTVLTRRIAVAPDQWRAAAAQALGLLVLVVAVSVTLCLVGGALLGRHDLSYALTIALLMAAAVSSIHVQRFSAGVFQGFETFDFENVGKVVQAVLFAGSVLLLVRPRDTALENVLALFAVSHWVAAMLLAVPLIFRWRSLALQLRPALLVDWLGEAGPLGAADVLRRLTNQLDVVILGLLQPASVVAVYSVANRPLASLNWLPYVVLSATLPSFARLAGADSHALGRTFSTSLRLLWITALPLAIAVFACAELIVQVMAGREYLEAALPLRILIWIAVAVFLTVPARFLFAALARSRLYLLLVLSTTLLGAGSQIALIPRLGYLGACLGSLIGELYFVGAVFIVCGYMGALQIDVRAMLGAAFAGLVMAVIALAPSSDTPVLQCLATLLGLVVYLLLCAALGAIRTEELHHLGQTLHRMVPSFLTLRSRRSRESDVTTPLVPGTAACDTVVMALQTEKADGA